MNGVEKIHNIARASDSASPARRRPPEGHQKHSRQAERQSQAQRHHEQGEDLFTWIGIAHQSQTNGSQPLSLTCTLSNRQSDAELFGGDSAPACVTPDPRLSPGAAFSCEENYSSSCANSNFRQGGGAPKPAFEAPALPCDSCRRNVRPHPANSRRCSAGQ
jgi:hypothetical protein